MFLNILIVISRVGSGFLENISITFINKADSSEFEKRENYWIRLLKIMVPWGLNIM